MKISPRSIQRKFCESASFRISFFFYWTPYACCSYLLNGNKLAWQLISSKNRKKKIFFPYISRLPKLFHYFLTVRSVWNDMNCGNTNEMSMWPSQWIAIWAIAKIARKKVFRDLKPRKTFFRAISEIAQIAIHCDGHILIVSAPMARFFIHCFDSPLIVYNPLSHARWLVTRSKLSRVSIQSTCRARHRLCNSSWFRLEGFASARARIERKEIASKLSLHEGKNSHIGINSRQIRQ